MSPKYDFKNEQEVQLLYTLRDTRHCQLHSNFGHRTCHSLRHRHFQYMTAKVLFHTHPKENASISKLSDLYFQEGEPNRLYSATSDLIN